MDAIVPERSFMSQLQWLTPYKSYNEAKTALVSRSPGDLGFRRRLRTRGCGESGQVSLTESTMRDARPLSW